MKDKPVKYTFTEEEPQPPGIAQYVDTELAEIEGEESEVRQSLEKAKHDPEAGTSSIPVKLEKESPNPNIVKWDENDPEHPRNFPTSKKWITMSIVAAYAFLSPLSSSILGPALPTLASEFNNTNHTITALYLSVFVLAYAVGPLFLGPLSEIYGRSIVIQGANFFFLAWTIACSRAMSTGEIIAYRFLAGLGGSAAISIGGGVIGDMFDAEQRGKALAIYSMGPLIGPIFGPIAGGFITQYIGWRWIFYIISMICAVVNVLGVIWLHETFAPVLLQRKRNRLAKETGNKELITELEAKQKKISLGRLLMINLKRPFAMLFTSLIVFMLSLYMGIIYGILYLMFTTFPSLFQIGYGMETGISGLNYLGPGIGFTIAAIIGAKVSDRIYIKMKQDNGGVGMPEFRLPPMIVGAFLIPVGILIYGWCAEYLTHWIVPNIGACIFSCGMLLGFLCMQTYLVDTFTLYAASAMSAVTIFRSLFGFGFPLFGSQMFDAMGYGWGNTLLAGISIIIGIPFPIALFKYGARIRAMNKRDYS
eukprot:TRINITY_DN5918_c0_g1_i1.p1 TRINITY_DN5918_c0_g1~~TRINITY_DN5918_c0_g1_i1.p1  ORF type:complete len:534 (+),score=74.70 TRINITY_DN5918_c0_g1_i1:173-1774(+)